MKLSLSIQIIWQLAAREAIAGKFKNIEPEHFFAAVLKFSEIPLEELKKVSQDSGSSEELTSELDAVCQRLNQHQFDSALVRRQLRALLGKSNHIYTGSNMHRSAASKLLFDTAFKLAADSDSSIVKAIHLLQAIFDSPTPHITQVLNKAKIRPALKPFPTHLLDKWGRDLTNLTNQSKLFRRSGRKVESKALIRALVQKDHPCVFLISAKDEDVQQVVEAIATEIASKACPQKLQSKRIIDISSLKLDDAADPKAEIAKLISQLFAEAALNKDIILYGPAITGDHNIKMPDNRVEIIRQAVTRHAVKCIFRLEPQIYENLVKKDPVWHRLSEVMWLRSGNGLKIPNEI